MSSDISLVKSVATSLQIVDGMSVRPSQGRQVAERIAHVVLDVGLAGHEARELLQL
jgi:hypothetical protein